MKILLIADHAPDALLDVQCVIQRLRRKYRECRISLMAPQALQALARRLEGVDDLLTLPERDASVKVFWIAGRQLEEWQKEVVSFDQALLFTRRWKPALVPWMAGVPRRSGLLGRCRFMLVNDARWMSPRQFPGRRTQYLALADDHGEMPDEVILPAVVSDRDNGHQLLQRFYISQERPALVFCPGGDLPSGQRWPTDRWSALAAQLIDQGWQIWLIAPSKEQALSEAICAGLDRERQMEITNLTGKLAWDDKIDLMAASRAVLAQETLYSQLALALNHPLVVLQGAGYLSEFLPRHPEQYGQQHGLVSERPVQPVFSGKACQPCQEPNCQQSANGATDPCLQGLSVERVRSALLSMVPMQAVD